MPERARKLPEWAHLRDVARDAWVAHARTAGLPGVVSPSIPLLYLGDAERFLLSPVRVVTVGLGPARREFPQGDPWARFPRARPLDPETAEDADVDLYLSSLNGYFRTEPNVKAFDGTFEPLLNGLGASYYGVETVAVHTHLRTTAVVASPWSRVPAPTRTALAAEAGRLWHDLIEALDPHLIVVSVPPADLGRVRFEPDEPFAAVYSDEGGTSPYRIQLRHVRVNGRRVPLVHGEAGMTPFGGLDGARKYDAGEQLRARLPG